MEEMTKNPLELSCEEAAEIIKMQSEEKASFIEEVLLEEHLKKCEKCRELQNKERG